MKRIQTTKFNQFVLGLAATTALIAASNAAYALPTGGVVSAGTANIDNSIANQVNITQTTNKAVINWASFNTGSGDTVNVTGPSSQSLTVHRVSGGRTQFDGTLNANNQQWIINPNGVTFGGTARVNVGSLLVSTAGISDEAIMNPAIVGGNELYAFAEPSNHDASIDVNPGAIIIATSAGNTYLQKNLHPTVNETLSCVTEGGSCEGNWQEGTNTDVINFHHNDGWYADAWVATNNHPISVEDGVGFDLVGTGDPTRNLGNTYLRSKDFDVKAGIVNIKQLVGGNGGRVVGPGVHDDVQIKLVKSDGTVLQTLSWNNLQSMDPFTQQSFLYNAADNMSVHLEVTSQLFRPGFNPFGNVGASYIPGNYYANQSSYIQFMAPTIKVRGAEIAADRIAMASGRTFNVKSADYGNGGEYVYAADPVLATNFTNGGNRNIFVERSYLNAGPNGLIEFDTTVTQGAFDAFNDTNGNGINDDFQPNGTWVGYPPQDGYEGMEVRGGGEEEFSGLYAGNFRSRYTIVPGSVYTPTLLNFLPNFRDEGLDRFFISEANVAKAQTENNFNYERANIADRGLAIREGVMNLAGAGGITINGKNPANLAPAAGGSPEELNALGSSAGGSAPAAAATGNTNCAMMALGNEGLDPEGQRYNCSIDNDANKG